jgi:antitoxin CptB
MNELLKKKLIYRSCNRGCKETDFMLGKFVICDINKLNEMELKQLTKLLEESDNDIYHWLTGQKPIPLIWQNSLVEKIINFNKTQDIVKY